MERTSSAEIKAHISPLTGLHCLNRHIKDAETVSLIGQIVRIKVCMAPVLYNVLWLSSLLILLDLSTALRACVYRYTIDNGGGTHFSCFLSQFWTISHFKNVNIIFVFLLALLPPPSVIKLTIFPLLCHNALQNFCVYI